MADINTAPSILQAPANLYQQILANQGTQANTALTQQQAQGAAIANQRAGMQLQAYQGLLGMLNGQNQSQTSPAEQQTQDRSGVDEAPTLKNGDIDRGAVSSAIDGEYQQAAYIPSPRIRMINAASAAAGAPELGQAYMAQEKAAWDQQQQTRQIGANHTLQQVYDLQDAVKGGTGLAQLRDMDPAAAASLEAKAKASGWSDAELNQHVGQWADAVGSAVFRHTGREISDNNGTPFDKQAGRAVPGGERGPLSSQQLADVYKSALEPVKIGDQLPQPRWKVEGFPTPGAYVAATAAAAGQGASGATQGPAQSANAAPAPSNASPQAPAQAGPPAAAPAPKAPAQNPEAPTPYGVPAKAFQDPDYKLTPPKAPKTEEDLAANTEEQKAVIASKNSLLDSSGEVTAASARALQYFSAAKSILAAPDAAHIAGVPGSILGELNKLGFNLDDANSRTEAVKYLTNGALQGLKQTYGSKPAQFDVKVNLEQAFPDVKSQGLGAVQNLVDYNIRAAQYDLASARRVNGYLAAGLDPRKFNQWNEQYASRSANINQAPAEAKTSMPRVATQADYDKVPAGAQYTAPDGSVRRKGG